MAAKPKAGQIVRRQRVYGRMVRSNIIPVSNKKANTSAWIALGAVCILWGTTYLAIRIALDAFPPFYLMAFRYSLSGGILLIGAKLMGARLPSGRELWLTAVFGITTIGMGTGLLCVAEQWVPTGLSALFIATQPFWMVVVEWILSRGGHRPHGATVRGLVIGIAGVAVLVAPEAVQHGWKGETFLGFLLLQLGCAGWVTGALLRKDWVWKRTPLSREPCSSSRRAYSSSSPPFSSSMRPEQSRGGL